jgi:hypothetical protein
MFEHPSVCRATIKGADDRKEKYMPTDFENRVLVRRNARQLSAEEFQQVMEHGKPQMTQLPSTPYHPDF